MTAAVALALPQEGPMETSALARRSRMGILRGNSDPSPEVTAAGPPPKKRKVSGSEPVSPNGSRTSIENSSSAETKEGIASKKAQKKYEPSVPMTKEEAAAWRREQRRKYPNDDVSSDEFAAQREGTARERGATKPPGDDLTRHPSAFCSHYAGTRRCFSRPQRPRAADGLCARLAPSHAVLRHWCAGRHGVPCLDLQGEGRFDCARCKCRIETVSNAFLLLLLLTSAHHCADYASWIAHSMR